MCQVRRNLDGRLSLPFYGLLSGTAVDPIEKKPLHHFLPGSEVFSAGFVGCNMRCPFCQNWTISQHTEAAIRRSSPRELVDMARASGTPSIAYTYSEPSIHFEFLVDTMKLARSAGLKNVLVTNGCLLEGPARELLSLVDATNVDLKCWSEDSYKKTLGGELRSVLTFIRIAAELCHLEVTTLVVPGLSNSSEDIGGIADFLASLSPDIPLHLSAYHPAWKHEAPPTDGRELEKLAARARRSLHYVYLGNVRGPGSDTRCPHCSAVVIRRIGYSIDTGGLKITGGRTQGACAACGAALPIVV